MRDFTILRKTGDEEPEQDYAVLGGRSGRRSDEGTNACPFVARNSARECDTKRLAA